MTTRTSPPTERVVGVLNLLAAADGGVRASEVARRLQITTSTCATLLSTLAAADYVERGPDKTYRLGSGLLALAEAMRERFPLLGGGHEELRRLGSDLGCGVTLTRIAGDHLRVVAAIGTADQRPFGVASGDRFPLSPPYGAIAMAWRPEDEVNGWLETWSLLSAAERAHERRVMADIRRSGIGVWSLEPYAVPVVRRMGTIIEDLTDHLPSGQLREQLTDLFAMLGRRGYTAEELAQRRSVSVGYALAAIFGPDQQPRYQIDVHLLRPAVSRKAVGELLRRLSLAAAALTAMIGGAAPALRSGTASRPARREPARREPA